MPMGFYDEKLHAWVSSDNGQVFDIVRTLEPSARGELEITDVNNAYIARGQMTYDVLDGWWTDAGTIESIHRAANLVREGGANRVGDGVEGRRTI